MNITDKARTITAVRATGPSSLHLSWSEGTAADLDLGAVLADRALAALRDPGAFAKVEVGDWGHSLAWPSGAELGADRSEEHTSELQSLMRRTSAVLCLHKKHCSTSTIHRSYCTDHSNTLTHPLQPLPTHA